jgi:uncharacterized protein YegL
MFTISAHQNRAIAAGQASMQAVLSIHLPSEVAFTPAPLAIAIVLDQSGSMEGPKLQAAREGAARIIATLDDNTIFTVIAFNARANPVFGPAYATPSARQQASQALRTIIASSGTCMSTGLHAAIEALGNEPGRAKQILFLTDGKNEGEARGQLDSAVARCAAAGISVTAWGIGTDWDERELRAIVERTHGTADIIPSARQIESSLSMAFHQIRQTVVTDLQLLLWTPIGVTIASIQQSYPQLIAVASTPHPDNPRQIQIGLGNCALGDTRDLLLEFTLPTYPAGQQFVIARPTLLYTSSGSMHEQKSNRAGWIVAEVTDDPKQAAQIDPQVAHYTDQEELAAWLREGQEALALGDLGRATRILGQALNLSEQSGNAPITRMLKTIVLRDQAGTIQLNPQADLVARKTLAINIGRTSKIR